MSENKVYGSESLMSGEQQELSTFDPNVAYGFEETDSSDIVIPRIKVINALSPERVDGEAQEGAVLNSLTKEDVRGWHFVPIKQYYSCIRWNPDRDCDPRMLCRSYDGRIGIDARAISTCASSAASISSTTRRPARRRSRSAPGTSTSLASLRRTRCLWC